MDKTMIQEILGDRQQKILVAVVCEYISTADPVGSRTIARKYDVGSQLIKGFVSISIISTVPEEQRKR
jgi:hypothetical protein